VRNWQCLEQLVEPQDLAAPLETKVDGSQLDLFVFTTSELCVRLSSFSGIGGVLVLVVFWIDPLKFPATTDNIAKHTI
jgi:hypothetical protein